MQKLEKRVQSIEEARLATVQELSSESGKSDNLCTVSNEKIKELACCTIELKNKVDNFEKEFANAKDLQTLQDLVSLTTADVRKAWTRIERLGQIVSDQPKSMSTEAEEYSGKRQIGAFDGLPEVHKISSSPGRGFNALMNEARLRRKEKEGKPAGLKSQEVHPEKVEGVLAPLKIKEEKNFIPGRRSSSSQRPSSKPKENPSRQLFRPPQHQEFASSLLNF